MIFDVAGLLALAASCAPSVAPETLIAIVHTESRFDSLAIGINSAGVRNPAAISKAQAVASARRLMRQGYNIDLGLGQINSANLAWLGLSVEDAFEPCPNLAAAARVMATNYQAVVRTSSSREQAIATALSLYNTGDRRRGFRNGYVARVYASAAAVIPQIRGRATTMLMAQKPSVDPMPTAAKRPNSAPVTASAWATEAAAQKASLMVFGDLATFEKGQNP